MNYETTVDLSGAKDTETGLDRSERGSRGQRRLWIVAAIVLVALLVGYMVYARSGGGIRWRTSHCF